LNVIRDREGLVERERVVSVAVKEVFLSIVGFLYLEADL
jgi:hypothetical protein